MLFGSRLRALRHSRRGWPDYRLAEGIGISTYLLRRIERGEKGPLIRSRIEKALELLEAKDQLPFMLLLADWDRGVRRNIPFEARYLTGVLDAIGIAHSCGYLNEERARRLKAYVENMGKEELNGRDNEAD